MITFKKFLESLRPEDTMKEMSLVLKLRKHIGPAHISNEDARKLIAWAVDDAGNIYDLADNAIERIFKVYSDSMVGDGETMPYDISGVQRDVATTISHLREDALEAQRYELILRKEVGLSKDDAKTALYWWADAWSRTLNGKIMNFLRDWTFDQPSLSYKDKKLKDTGAAKQKDPNTTKIFVIGALARMVRSKYGMEPPTKETLNENSLHDLAFELAIRKEYKATKEQAKETLKWFRNELDWVDVGYDTRAIYVHYFGEDFKHHPGLSYGDAVMDEISKTLRSKYNIDSREYL